MLELYLVRHGQTEASRDGRFCGALDPPLTDVGLRMAELLGSAYADKNLVGLYSSPSRRARDTIAPLAARLGIEPVVDVRLAEISYGEFEGLTPVEARARAPEAFAYWQADSAGRAPPGGETAFQVAARAALAVERVKREHPDGRVLIVSHKATTRILICALLGLDVRLFRERIALPVAAVTRFAIGPRGAMLTRLGDDSHLPAELRELEGT